MSVFGSKKKTSETPKATNMSGSNILINGTHIKGTIKSSNDLRIDGKVEGDIYCKARLLIGKNAEIDGNIFADYAYIEGTVNGNIATYELAHFKESGFLNGDLATKQLIVDEGARIMGKCETNKSIGQAENKKSMNAKALKESEDSNDVSRKAS